VLIVVGIVMMILPMCFFYGNGKSFWVVEVFFITIKSFYGGVYLGCG
jgi:hypothetical protein